MTNRDPWVAFFDQVARPSRLVLGKKFFHIWFIYTREGCVLVLHLFFIAKCNLWNTLVYNDKIQKDIYHCIVGFLSNINRGGICRATVKRTLRKFTFEQRRRYLSSKSQFSGLHFLTLHLVCIVGSLMYRICIWLMFDVFGADPEEFGAGVTVHTARIQTCGVIV